MQHPGKDHLKFASYVKMWGKETRWKNQLTQQMSLKCSKGEALFKPLCALLDETALN